MEILSNGAPVEEVEGGQDVVDGGGPGPGGNNNNLGEYKNRNVVDWGEYEDDERAYRAMQLAHLTRRLEAELRAAKGTHLSCGEVLLPCDLLPRASRAILDAAESEPCGLRGCTLHLDFEAAACSAGEQAPSTRRLTTVECDPYTASTFELYLTLREDGGGSAAAGGMWRFFRKFTRSPGTLVICPNYELIKRKLYRSYCQ